MLVAEGSPASTRGQRPAPLDFFSHVASLAASSSVPRFSNGIELIAPPWRFAEQPSKETEVIPPLLIHEAQKAFEHDSTFHDSCPRQNGFHVLLERGIRDGGRTACAMPRISCDFWLGSEYQYPETTL